ncbi:MAG TPA: c-type cytochrome [Ktedonobacteraceae bacterium]|nr:c-type cytochrome [Ktedonobacteraceae bacterium]
MIDPIQATIGIVVLLITVGALLYIFYSRTNAVEKTGYGALMMLALVSLLIPVFWIMETNNEAVAKATQHTTAVQRGEALYAQYCYQCHGTKGQGRSGPKLNGNPIVNGLTDNDLLRIISGGIYDPANPANPLMPAWSERYGGPLTDNDIQYLFELIRSSDPAYLSKNGYTGSDAFNGFDQLKDYFLTNNPSGYQTAVAQEGAGQFGKPVDMTTKKAITINIIQPPAGATCSPACYQILNVKVKVGTVITWDNQSQQIHTVTAIVGTDPSNEKAAPQIFDSGLSKPIPTGGTYSYTVTTAAYNFNPDHTVIYYCQFHPGMIAELTIVP